MGRIKRPREFGDPDYIRMDQAVFKLLMTQCLIWTRVLLESDKCRCVAALSGLFSPAFLMQKYKNFINILTWS